MDEIGEAVGFKLFPQAAYVDGQCVVINVAVGFPEQIHKAFPAYNPALVFHQQAENPVFVFCQINCDVLIGEGSVFHVEEGSPVLCNGHDFRKIISAAQKGLYLGNEHVHIKGLCHKVVAAHAHCHNHIHVVGGGGQEKNGDFGQPAKLGAPVISVEGRKADVHNDQVRLYFRKFREDFAEVFYTVDLEFPFFTFCFYCFQDSLVVLYHIDAVHVCLCVPFCFLFCVLFCLMSAVS